MFQNAQTQLETTMSGTLLIVDDDHIQVEIVAKVLGTSGYDYKWAPTVERAKALLAARYFSAVLCDLSVETLDDGFELIRWIRKREGISDIPIIIMTASASAETVVKARSIGVEGFVVKPFTPRGLLKVMAHAVAGSTRRVGVKTRLLGTDALQACVDAEAETQSGNVTI